MVIQCYICISLYVCISGNMGQMEKQLSTTSQCGNDILGTANNHCCGGKQNKQLFIYTHNIFIVI